MKQIFKIINMNNILTKVIKVETDYNSIFDRKLIKATT